ncbi:MAG: ABC transporter ATP-binding protein [Candidatus Aminicenantes bacterium]
MNKPVIEAKDIVKIYNKGSSGEVTAVKDVSIEVGKGEFVALMGASGSGKSTLMNIISCLDRPTSGHVILDNIEVSRLEDEEMAKVRNKKIGFVFQMFNLLPRTNALENVELPLIYSDRSDITRLAREALETVGLKDRIHHNPNELSGGEQQRVAVARALVNNPEIIFADEPTGNLDSKSSYEIMSLFKKLHQQGRTIVLVTHEADIAEYAERTLVIADGKIIDDKRNPQIKGGEKNVENIPAGEKKQ